MLVSTDSASSKYTPPAEVDVEEAVGAGTAGGQSASVVHQSSVTSPPSSAGAGQAQSAVNIAVSAQAYVQLPQLVDCISPYTAVDTA